MTTPAQVKEKLLKKWERGLFFAPGVGDFPLRVPLGAVPASVLTDRFEDVRRWTALFDETGRDTSYEVEWREINHRLYGRNRLPAALIFEGPEEAARFLGRSGELRQFRLLRDRLAETDPRLAAWADGAPFALLGCAADLDRLILLWRWMADHPRPGIYLRQIDLPGIDTKFTEGYKALLSSWLDLTLPAEVIAGDFSGAGHFEERYGYRKKPETVRMRFLDPALFWQGCSDLSLAGEEFRRLYGDVSPPRPSRIFVVENDITALSFPPVEGAAVLFGRGYHFDHLRGAAWLNEGDLWYWGDLDTHGFCILDQFRGIFPRARSFLMDRKTLLDHESSWGREPRPASQELTRLTEAEKLLYEDLRFNRLGENLRLEQEFVRMGALGTFLAGEGFVTLPPR